VGAMAEESFAAKIAPFDPRSLVVVTGDRRNIQLAAVKRSVRLLVVTGGFPVDADVVRMAREQGVTLVSTPLDTAATVSRARLSTPAGDLAEPLFESIGVDEPLSRLREKLLHAAQSAVLVLEEDGTLAGVATKSSLFAPLPGFLAYYAGSVVASSVTVPFVALCWTVMYFDLGAGR